MFDLRLLHLADELSRIGAETFHVAPLAFGVDGIDGQGTLAGAAGATTNGHPIARDFRVDIAQALDLIDKPWRLHFTIGTSLL